MSATATTTAAPAAAIWSVISSPRSAQPRKTATIGFTYAYVATSESGATRSSQTYAVKPTKLPTTTR